MGGRLVQDEDALVGQERAGDPEPRPLRVLAEFLGDRLERYVELFSGLVGDSRTS